MMQTGKPEVPLIINRKRADVFTGFKKTSALVG
jgi:hypothetical protein